MTDIATEVFYNCTSLSTMICRASEPPSASPETSFFNVDSTMNLQVPNHSIPSYSSTSPWSRFFITSLPYDYEIEVAASPENAGTITGTEGYSDGEIVKLVAVPYEGFLFEKWTLNGETISSDSILTFPATESISLEAHFAIYDNISDNQYVDAVIYPNPANDIIVIKSDGMTNLSIYSLNGELKYQADSIDNDMYIVDTHNFPNGIYFIEIKSKEGLVVRKMVKY